MTSTLDLLGGAVRAVTFHPPASFTWFGQGVDDVPNEMIEAMTPETAREYLRYNLQWQLYQNFYCRGFAAPRIGMNDGLPPAKSSLVEVLSAANCGRGPFEPGWRVEAFEGGRLVVARDGLRLWVGPEEVTAAAGEEIALGAEVLVRFPKELRKLLPGFYMALGDSALPEREEPIVRLYWNLTPKGAPALVQLLTAQLNQAGLAFRLKVVDNERAFNRCDAGVLYVRTADYAQVVAMLPAVYGELARHLKPAVPALTKPLAPGLGLAEEPGTGDSFGVHCCGLIAEGMIRARDAGALGVDERLAVVADCLREAGVSLEAPFLNPGSRDDYLWPVALEGGDAGLFR